MKCCVYVNREVEPQAKERICADCLLDWENVDRWGQGESCFPRIGANSLIGISHLLFSSEWRVAGGEKSAGGLIGGNTALEQVFPFGINWRHLRIINTLHSNKERDRLISSRNKFLRGRIVGRKYLVRRLGRSDHLVYTVSSFFQLVLIPGFRMLITPPCPKPFNTKERFPCQIHTRCWIEETFSLLQDLHY